MSPEIRDAIIAHFDRLSDDDLAEFCDSHGIALPKWGFAVTLRVSGMVSAVSRKHAKTQVDDSLWEVRSDEAGVTVDDTDTQSIDLGPF